MPFPVLKFYLVDPRIGLEGQKEDYMKKVLIVLTGFLVAVATMLVGKYAMGAEKVMPEKKPDMEHKMMMPTKSQVMLKMAMRKLWEDHITYTRNYIISALAGLDDAPKVADRLMRNQQDIGDAIKPYYGKAAGDKLAGLLKDHISIAAEVVAAAKSGNKADLDKSQSKWKKNADDLAAFLSEANPNWPKKEMADMLYMHLDFTTQEVVARLHKDWVADIAAYDKGHEHMLKFADMLSHGIMKQFPDKFKE
jgi:hypothetical protein